MSVQPSGVGMTTRIIDLIKTPYYAAQLASGAKSFRDNPILGSARLNNAGLHVARVRLAHQVAESRRRRLAQLVSHEDAAAFDRDGFVLKRDFLPQDTFDALKSEILACRAPARQMIQGDTITRRMALDTRTLERLPHAKALLDSPEWLGLIRYVGSSKLHPLTYVQTIQSHVRDTVPDPQTNLHADTFHPTVKAWLFLTDVAEDEGPFVYVPGSHRPTPERLDWERRMSLRASANADILAARGSPRISAEEIAQLGLPEPKAFAVKANTLVVADTVGFHARGFSARPTTRIEIWAYGRRNPFLPWTGGDPAGLPGVRGNAIPLFWWAMDQAEKHGLARNPWRPSGMVTPDSPPDVTPNA